MDESQLRSGRSTLTKNGVHPLEKYVDRGGQSRRGLSGSQHLTDEGLACIFSFPESLWGPAATTRFLQASPLTPV